MRGFCLEKHTHAMFIKSNTQKLLVPSTVGLFMFWWILGYFNMKIGGAFEVMGDVPKPIVYLYSDMYKEQVINLILDIQNNEEGIVLSIGEQPDLKDINRYYADGGSVFWIALGGNDVIGTIGLMMKENGCAVLKKFFVKAEYRGCGIGLQLYQRLIEFARGNGVRHIVPDTPSVARKSHRFYERAGFYKTEKAHIPIKYEYPDRQSILYMPGLQ